LRESHSSQRNLKSLRTFARELNQPFSLEIAQLGRIGVVEISASNVFQARSASIEPANQIGSG